MFKHFSCYYTSNYYQCSFANNKNNIKVSGYNNNNNNDNNDMLSYGPSEQAWLLELKVFLTRPHLKSYVTFLAKYLTTSRKFSCNACDDIPLSAREHIVFYILKQSHFVGVLLFHSIIVIDMHVPPAPLSDWVS